MKDFFGYKREVRPNGQIASSELATLNMGGRMGLVQQFTGTYGQTVQAKYELGSPTLFWVAGQPSGNIQFGRLVGKGGFLQGLSQLKDSCGSILQLSFGLDGTGACANSIRTSGRINFSGALPEQLTFSSSAGTLEISEGATLRVSSMTKE